MKMISKIKKIKRPDYRKCIATNQVKPRSELIRIVKTKKPEFFVNSEVKGRGAYISKDANLVPILFKKKLLNRTFKCDVPLAIYEQLKKIMEDENER